MPENVEKLTLNYSPNFNTTKRSYKDIKFVIIHYTGMKSETLAIKRLSDAKSKVSAHYFIKDNGKIINIDKSITISRSKNQRVKNEPILIQKNYKIKIEYVEMPNLIGKTVRDAFSDLKKVGIKPQISGRGLIVSQSIEAGTKIEKESICILKAELKE